MSREKVGQMLRDSLGSKYRSSSKAKKRRRVENSAKISNGIEHVISSLPEVSSTMTELSNTIKSQQELSDEDVLMLATQANIQLLNAFKSQPGLAMKFQTLSSPECCSSDSDDSSSVDDNDSSTDPMME